MNSEISIWVRGEFVWELVYVRLPVRLEGLGFRSEFRALVVAFQVWQRFSRSLSSTLLPFLF